jgi:phenylacetate-CoA ligase
MLFARYCERERLRLPSLQFILCSYEYVSVLHRRVLERVFGVPVFNLYGSTETGHLLMETERGTMAPSVETAFLETIETDAQGVGELVVTTLTNEYMPLIRYRIGDLVERDGTSAGAFGHVHGRVADAFLTPDGARVTTRHVDACFDGIPGIVHYQLHEQQDDAWSLRWVADATPPSPSQLDELRHRLSDTLELHGRLELSPAAALLAGDSGKFRLGFPAPSAVQRG